MSAFPSEIETVPITELCPAVGDAEALRRWTGFAQLFPPEPSAGARPARLINADHPEWYRERHEAVGVASAIGCHLLRDVTISGHGLRFHRGRLITDTSSLSEASLRLLHRQNRRNLDDEISGRAEIRIPYGLVVHDAGYWIHGHWLVDFLPRIAAAVDVLGSKLDVVPLVLPHDTPSWTFGLLHEIFGIKSSSCVIYHRTKEVVRCDRLCIPTYAYAGDHFLHSYFRRLYANHRTLGTAPGRKYVISRRNFEVNTKGALKRFENRGYFERAAKARGYEVFCPETLPIPVQIRMFSEADIILGEYGSGLHNSVFSRPGVVVGAVRMLNAIQSRIGAAMDQVNVYGFPDREWQDQQTGDTYCIDADKIDALIDAADGAWREEQVRRA